MCGCKKKTYNPKAKILKKKSPDSLNKTDLSADLTALHWIALVLQIFGILK